MNQSETDIKALIMLELSKHGIKIFNRPTGKFYSKNEKTGEYIPIKINIKGASDLSGHVSATGRAVYIECKTPEAYVALKSRIARNKLTQHDRDQINFINTMQQSNALAGFASSVEQALEICGITP